MQPARHLKFRRAIKAKTRVSTGTIYRPGDIVFYKRENFNMWEGPGTIIDRENKQITLNHGGTQIRVYACQLQHAKDLQIDHANGK